MGSKTDLVYASPLSYSAVLLNCSEWSIRGVALVDMEILLDPSLMSGRGHTVYQGLLHYSYFRDPRKPEG
jgi:hypothetical protein